MVKETYGEPEDVNEELDSIKYIDNHEERLAEIQRGYDEEEIAEEEPYTDPEDLYIYKNEVEEEEILRYHPNSTEAIEQYTQMRLADLEDEWVRGMLSILFNKPFEPSSDKDMLIFEHIEQERESFFGPDSVWNNKGTMAELILHFANLDDFDNGGGIEYWARFILTNVDLMGQISQMRLETRCEAIMQHKYYNETGQITTFGIFGLDPSDPEVDFEGLSFMEQYWKSQPDELIVEDWDDDSEFEREFGEVDY